MECEDRTLLPGGVYKRGVAEQTAIKQQYSSNSSSVKELLNKRDEVRSMLAKRRNEVEDVAQNEKLHTS